MNTRGIISLAASALIIAATSAHTANIVWINTAGGNWSDTNSWNPNQVPGSGDVAVITNDGTYSVTLDVNPTISGLVLGTAGGANIQSLSVGNNQTLTLNGTAQVGTNGQFNLNGGVLGGNIVLCGALNCAAGTLSGGLTVNSNSVLTVSAPGVGLNSFTPGSSVLTNYGTVNWTGGDISCDGGPLIYNYGLWNAQTDNSIFGQQTSGNTTFNNFGTFRKSGGTGTTTLDSNSTFNVSGTVDVESGTVSIADGQYAGAVNTTGGTFLSLGNSLIFGGSTLFTGTGSVEGSVIGSNAVFSGTMTCSGVTISGAITVATNAVVNLGTLGVDLNNSYNNTALLTNYGTINWSSDLTCDGGPQIYNYGLWNAQTDNSIFGQQTSGNATFNNFGTFRKSSGTGITTLDNSTIFNNTGTLDVQSGTVSILGSETLSGGTLNFGISSLNTFGHITLSGAVTLTGTVSVNLNSLYSPASGTSFALLTYGSESGVFTNFNLPVFFGWTNIYGPASFSLKIVAAPMRVLNVTNYGAVGDAAQFFANTVSNSVVVTTTNLVPNSAIGEVIELFGCGAVTIAPNCQDMVATITNIMDGTNIYVSQVPQATLTNTFATYGFNNTTAFKSTIAAVGADTNDTIYIPAGTYLLIPTSQSGAYSQCAIALQRGGINFVGAGTNDTSLLSRGAWTLINSSVNRGILVEIASPCTNNYPLTFSYLTMDGGVQQGNTGNHGFPPSTKDGTGWDTSHDAFLTWCVSSASFSHIYFTNDLIQHWRGEEFKSIDQPINSNIGIYGCTFADGNATALNVYESWDVRSNLFANLFQVAEYYQQYYSYPSYFEYNVITNITGNGFAFNGGKGNNPPFYMESNVFYLTSSGNGIETTPGDNIFVIGNCFTNIGNYVVNFDLSCPGAQGTFYNSNIVITANTIVNPYIFMELGGGSGPTDLNSVMSTAINNNIMITNGNNGALNLIVSYGGWTTNISFNSNDLSQCLHAGLAITTASIGRPYPLVSTNNLYWLGIATDGSYGGFILPISYVHGSRYQLRNDYSTSTVIFLDDTNAVSMPIGAQMLFTNSTANAQAVPIYPSANTNIAPVIVPYGQTALFYWRPATGTWSTNNRPLPPSIVGSSF